MALSPNWSLYVGDPSSLGAGQYQEVNTSGNADASVGNSQATRIFQVSWDVLPSFIDDLVGFSTLNGTTINWISLPDNHPVWSAFYVSEASFEGQGIRSFYTGNNSIRYELARVTAVYRPLPYNILPDNYISSGFNTTEMDRFTTRQVAYGTELLTIQGAMKFTTTKQAMTAQPARLTGYQELTYTWNLIPAKQQNQFVVPTLNNILSCLGTVNLVTFDPNGVNAPPGTVLFDGVDPQLVTAKLATGQVQRYWNIIYKMKYRNNGLVNRNGINENAGWQFAWDQQNGRWDLLTADGSLGGQRYYQTSDLMQLWVIT